MGCICTGRSMPTGCAGRSMPTGCKSPCLRLRARPGRSGSTLSGRLTSGLPPPRTGYHVARDTVPIVRETMPHGIPPPRFTEPAAPRHTTTVQCAAASPTLARIAAVSRCSSRAAGHPVPQQWYPVLHGVPWNSRAHVWLIRSLREASSWPSQLHPQADTSRTLESGEASRKRPDPSRTHPSPRVPPPRPPQQHQTRDSDSSRTSDVAERALKAEQHDTAGTLDEPMPSGQFEGDWTRHSRHICAGTCNRQRSGAAGRNQSIGSWV